jgi:hypothetical protein
MTLLAAVMATDDAGVSAGWLGFLIVVLIGVATYLLIRNMNARLKRLPKSFEADDDESSSGPTSGA